MSSVRVEFFAKRNPAVSFEDFQEQWTKSHAALFQQLIAKHPGVTGYTIYINPPALREALAAAGGAPQVDFDGSAILTGDSIEALAALQQDPFYKETVQPDSAKFMDPTSIHMRVGQSFDFVKDGANV